MREDEVTSEPVAAVPPARPEPVARTVHHRVPCETCGGHLGIAGSPAEHCEDTTHRHVDDPWSDRDLDWWTRRYALDLRIAQAHQARRWIPLTERLRGCGVYPAGDGIPSIVPADIDDAHEAATAIEALLELAELLAAADPADRPGTRAGAGGGDVIPQRQPCKPRCPWTCPRCRRRNPELHRG